MRHLVRIRNIKRGALERSLVTAAAIAMVVVPVISLSAPAAATTPALSGSIFLRDSSGTGHYASATATTNNAAIDATLVGKATPWVPVLNTGACGGGYVTATCPFTVATTYIGCPIYYFVDGNGNLPTTTTTGPVIANFQSKPVIKNLTTLQLDTTADYVATAQCSGSLTGPYGNLVSVQATNGTGVVRGMTEIVGGLSKPLQNNTLSTGNHLWGPSSN